MIAAALVLATAPSLARRTADLPACRAEQMSLGFDSEGGAFDGMSHSGALLVLRNLGPQACAMTGLPTLTLLDRGGRPLAIMRAPPIGMHPGPVVLPVGVAAGAELTAPLRWTSGEVFDHSRCFAPVAARVTLGAASVAGPFQGRLCGPVGGSVTFQQPVLRPDPSLDHGKNGEAAAP